MVVWLLLSFAWVAVVGGFLIAFDRFSLLMLAAMIAVIAAFPFALGGLS